MEPLNFHTSFYEHFLSTYGPQGADYPTFEPYYQFGHEIALDDEYRDRSYEEAEAELREMYERRYPQSDYDHFAAAIRYGYEVTRSAQR